MKILIKTKTKGMKMINQKIILSKSESDFMKYLPHPTMNTEPFLEICKKASIVDFFAIKEILSFLEKLKKYEIIEIKE